ncbi:MAG: hypothetical protein K0S99_1443, partial [Thermomicrobiales bacterium]|nr:hypothetical protein [Thermomicrobiales bacterium]
MVPTKPFPVERNSLRKEQLLEPLALLERRLHAQVGGARQNAFCERQDALERYQGGVDRAPCSTASAQQECLLSLKAERRIGNNVLQTVAPERATRRGTSHPGAQSQAVVDREKLGDRHVCRNLASAVDSAHEHRCL